MVLKMTLVFGLVVYALLWALALSGAGSLIPLLIVPAVLVVFVALGNWLSSTMGLPARRAPKFEKRDDPRP